MAFGDNNATNQFKTEAQQLQAYNLQAWVSIATDNLMRDAGGRKFWFVDRNEKEIDITRVDEAITLPFTNGYANQTFGQLAATIVGHRAITGNGYFLVTEISMFGANRGIPEAFIPISPACVKPIVSNSGLILKGYEVELEKGSKHILGVDEIIQFPQNTIFNNFVGVGNVEKARLMYETEARKSKYSNEFFKRGASPSMVITDESDRTADDIRRIGQQFNDKYAGEQNAGKLMYLAGKGIDAKAVQLSNKDMQFLEEKSFNRQTTLSLFGVPPVVAGIPDGANRAIAQTMRLQYLENTINPIIQSIEDSLNMQFVNKHDKNVFVRLAKHNTGDIENVVKKLQSGIITPNMAAEELGETVDDSLEERNIYYQPSGFMPVGYVPPAPVAPEPTNNEDDDEGKNVSRETCDCGLDHKNLNDPHNYELIVKAMGEGNTGIKKFQLEYLKNSLKSRAKTEDDYTEALEKFLYSQAKRVDKAFTENIEKITNLIANQNEVTEKKGFFDDLLTIVFNKKAEDEALREEIKPVHTSTVQKAIYNVNNIAGATVNPNLSNPVVKNMIDRLGKGIVETTTIAGVTYSVNDTARKEIARLVTKGIENGQTIEELQTTISKKLGDKSEARARRIARTESRIGYDEASKYAYKELGVKTIDVVGCTQFEPDSDCGKKNIPIDTPLHFHPNHVGAIVPSEQP